MNENIENKIKSILLSYSNLQKELSKTDISREDRVKFSKQFASLEQIIIIKKEIDGYEKELADTMNLLKENLEKDLE